jgi:hypothetical protein
VAYDIFNAIAHMAMLFLVGEIFILLVVPMLAIGLAGLIGLRRARQRLAEPVEQARALPRRGFMLVDRVCNAAAWPIIQATSLWRGAKAALAALSRR